VCGAVCPATATLARRGIGATDLPDEFGDDQASVLVEVIVVRRAAVVQYFTTNEDALRNRELIEDVLRELVARDPGGVDYQVLMLDDGVGFMHVVAFDGTTDPFADCAAHREFHRALAERLATPPVVMYGVLIGSYHGRKPGG
jgi:hypothetical protein